MLYLVPTMVSALPNPALKAFLAELGPELVMGEVLLRRKSSGYEISHVNDRERDPLRAMTLADLRQLAQFTGDGTFRPLKSAPTLQRGWRFFASAAEELDAALQAIYPSAVADWFAARQLHTPITHYRAYTSRQTGMYRITATLTDPQVASVARAGCHRRFCLKQRLWTIEGLEADSVEGKSVIPCLEPCAVLLEFARTVGRLEQRPRVAISLSLEEIESLGAALETKVEGPVKGRETEFSSCENPRRLQWIAEKLKTAAAATNES